MPANNSLVLITLRFDNEILPAVKSDSAQTSKSSRPKEAELVMARKLVAEMSGPWKPGQFHDTYREDLLKRIKEKVAKNQTHVLTSAPRQTRPKAEVIDLMDALKNSLKLRTKQAVRAGPKSAKTRKRA